MAEESSSIVNGRSMAGSYTAWFVEEDAHASRGESIDEPAIFLGDFFLRCALVQRKGCERVQLLAAFAHSINYTPYACQRLPEIQRSIEAPPTLLT